MACAVDSPSGNDFEATYSPWPLRMYVIENGTIKFISRPENGTHNVMELRGWLEERGRIGRGEEGRGMRVVRW
jgi:hypothetical protein